MRHVLTSMLANRFHYHTPPASPMNRELLDPAAEDPNTVAGEEVSFLVRWMAPCHRW